MNLYPNGDGEGTAGTGHTATQSDEHSVLAVFDATSSAWASNDVAAFVRCYTEDATVVLPGVHLQGKAAIRAAMAAAFAAPLKDSRRVHAAQTVRFLGPETAVVITRSVTILPTETGPAPTSGSWRHGYFPENVPAGSWRPTTAAPP